MKKIAILVGTRPEIIKMAPVMRQLRERKIPFVFIHSNQHYTKEMDEQIIIDLQLPKPDYQLRVGSASHAVQTGKIMEGVEAICLKEKISIMVVHGDTNTTLAGALCAKKLHLKVCHIEAGLRSFDYRMPEEVNRIITDRISDILFAPTITAKRNLLHEGIDKSTIVVTGNTVVDALYQHREIAAQRGEHRQQLLKEDEYILLTLHRAENVDDSDRFKKLLKLIEYVGKKLRAPILWPIHPRSKKQLEIFEITLPASIVTTDPIGYLDMINCMTHAKMILTDSGGIQEEAYILRKPLITLRDSTERPETLTANFIVDDSRKKVDEALQAYKKQGVSWKNAFGKGNASTLIVDTLVSEL